MTTTTVTRTEPGYVGDTTGIDICPKMVEAFVQVVQQYQEADNTDHYDHQKFTHPNDQVHGHFGHKYYRLDIGSSGAFMVDIKTGTIYGIKGYMKVDKNKISGNIYDPNFDGAVLVRDRFRYGRFENNPDGSIRKGALALSSKS